MALDARISLWIALATGVCLPRWLYTFAQWSESPPLRQVAWAVDVTCLIACAVALWRLQREVGDDDSRISAFIAIPGFALDAVTTLAVPWLETPSIVITLAVLAWTVGTIRWLNYRSLAVGAPYFLFRVGIVLIIISNVVEWLRPDGPGFPFALALHTAVAVQCAMTARFEARIAPP